MSASCLSVSLHIFFICSSSLCRSIRLLLSIIFNLFLTSPPSLFLPLSLSFLVLFPLFFIFPLFLFFHFLFLLSSPSMETKINISNFFQLTELVLVRSFSRVSVFFKIVLLGYLFPRLKEHGRLRRRRSGLRWRFIRKMISVKWSIFPFCACRVLKWNIAGMLWGGYYSEFVCVRVCAGCGFGGIMAQGGGGL